MTTHAYRQHAEALADLREHFYRTRIARGERLSLSEAGFLAERHGIRLRDGLRRILADSRGFPLDVINAIAEFAKALAEIREAYPPKNTPFPSGGLTTSN